MNVEYFRLTAGQVVPGKVIEWESSTGMDNVKRLIKSGDVVGQGTFDIHGQIDFLYWMPKKVINERT